MVDLKSVPNVIMIIANVCVRKSHKLQTSFEYERMSLEYLTVECQTATSYELNYRSVIIMNYILNQPVKQTSLI